MNRQTGTTQVKASQSQENVEVRLREDTGDAAQCRIFTSEEFFRAPTEVAELSARGAQFCIYTRNARIVVGSGQRPLKTERWTLKQRLQFKLRRLFHPATEPLDVSWIE